MGSIQLYPELYLVIFDRLHAWNRKKADLLNVCRTSRLFHELAEPLLFADIVLKTDDSEFGIDTRTRALLRDLTSRTETRQWVKSVKIKITSHRDDDKGINHIADVFVQLHNLRDIVFRYINLTRSMIQHLLRLSHPFRLNCWHVGCATKVEDLVSDTRNLPITGLIVSGVRKPNAVSLITRLALGPHLSVLDLGPFDWPYIYPGLLQNPYHNFDSLRRLEVHEPVGHADMTGFLSLLASCPYLSHLKIAYPSLISEKSYRPLFLPPSYIPHLSSVEAPNDLAGLLVRGRPVQSLRLTSRTTINLDRGFLSQLKEGSASLRELDVDGFVWRDDVLLDIAEYLPALQNLRVRFVNTKDFERMIEQLASGVQRLSPLQRFVMYGSLPLFPVDPNILNPLLEAVNVRLAHIGFRLGTEPSNDEMRWVFFPLSQL
ncbi:hypothetical protein FRB94_006825 [Tulasnella sp. JGI-2019a]|nr:hypothetical protein FRB94_006825 [Tulasnella sp. JGI-2019a]